jgi:hypothetical protein
LEAFHEDYQDHPANKGMGRLRAGLPRERETEVATKTGGAAHGEVTSARVGRLGSSLLVQCGSYSIFHSWAMNRLQIERLGNYASSRKSNLEVRLSK